MLRFCYEKRGKRQWLRVYERLLRGYRKMGRDHPDRQRFPIRRGPFPNRYPYGAATVLFLQSSIQV